MAGVKGLSGRKAGVPNKATAQARAAIAAFVDANANRLQGWLDQVANGVKNEETGEYVVPPDPERAYQLFQSVIEYHVPKLARTEMTGADGGPLEHAGTFTINFKSAPTKRD